MGYKDEDKQRDFQSKWECNKRARLKAEDPQKYEDFLEMKRQANIRYRERVEMREFIERIGMWAIHKYKFKASVVEKVLLNWLNYFEGEKQ